LPINSYDYSAMDVVTAIQLFNRNMFKLKEKMVLFYWRSSFFSPRWRNFTFLSQKKKIIDNRLLSLRNCLISLFQRSLSAFQQSLFSLSFFFSRFNPFLFSIFQDLITISSIFLIEIRKIEYFFQHQINQSPKSNKSQD